MDAIDRQEEFQGKPGASLHIYRYSRASLIIFLAIDFLLFLGSISFGAFPEMIDRWETNRDIERLVPALEDKDSRMREAAAQALGRMRDPRAVDPLVNALGDPMDGVRDAAAVALKNMNEPLGERIYESLKGSKKAWEELARINDPRAIAPIVKALGARNRNVRADAAWTLRKLGDPQAVEPLIKALGDQSPIVREAAAWALHDLEDRRAVDPMVKALGDAEESVREAAAWTLGKLKDQRAVEPLILALQDWFSKVREAAAWGLGELGDPRAIVPLIDALGDSHGKVREAATWTLGKFGDRRAVDPLLKTMGDEDPKVREAAARVLEEMGEPLGRLIQSTLGGSREARNELAGRKDPRSLDPLILSLRYHDAQVRRAAAAALGKIGDPRAIDGLVVMAGGWGLRDRWVATVALFEIDQEFYPVLMTAAFRVMACPASLVYLLCIAGIPILAVYGAGWIGRRRGRRA